MSEVSQEVKELKATAEKLGLKIHHSAGVEKIKEKIDEAKQEIAAALEEQKFIRTVGNNDDNAVRLRMRREALKEVRVIVTQLNPMKAKWEGEYKTVANSVTGDITKYVLYEKPWHVPQMVLDHLKECKYQKFLEKDVRRGDKIVKQKVSQFTPEYSIQILDKLTTKEMSDLAAHQALTPDED